MWENISKGKWGFVQIHTKANKIGISVIYFVIPFIYILNSFINWILDFQKLRVVGHVTPTLFKIFKDRDCSEGAGLFWAWECLLGTCRLLKWGWINAWKENKLVMADVPWELMHQVKFFPVLSTEVKVRINFSLKARNFVTLICQLSEMV